MKLGATAIGLVALLLVCLTPALGLESTDGRPDRPPERIVSLAPQITEILYALGLEDSLVGVTTFCDYPPAAREKPKVGGMSNPSLETVVSLKPDLVMLTTDGNPRQAEEHLSSLGIRTYVLRTRRIRELPDAVRDMAAFLGRKSLGETFAVAFERDLASLKARGNGTRPPLKALFVVWPEPLVVAGPGTAIDDAFEILGLDNIAGDAGLQYPKYSAEEILLRRPDVIFIGAMNGDIRKTSQGFLARLSSLDSVKNGRVYYPGDSLYRLGPRVIEGIRELRTLLGTDVSGEETR